ncbi:hypothetical protein KVT40_006804 [Elsinoe batatas]|uniref:Uncharacterized protein n=1 Tax=Elsinoe batatas TaxID=2601811 RepID=A0A8K0KYR4_9PEZI|nr:hypothetical protein KVT40_006804 [Elsinoe batatas]
MDSMRSLNTSLPRTSPQRQGQAQSQTQRQQQQQQSPEDLLSAFKQAALSVTTLYKSAASLQTSAKSTGYQAAIEDLLRFLDKENLGLTDGEGWRVRQWATERFDGGVAARHESDDEEEDIHEEERAESVPADGEQKDSTGPEDDLSSSVELPPQEEETTDVRPSSDQQSTVSPHSRPTFTFRSPHEYPTNHDRDINMEATNENKTQTQPPAETNNSQPFKFEATPTARPARTRQTRLGPQRSNTSLRNLGGGAGSKRKFPLGDFFDISGINFDNNHGSDRGGKRGRHA